MGWVHKAGRRPYYRQSWRENGRIVQKYFPAGEAARLAAEADKERRRKKRKWRQEERIKAARVREIGERVEDYYRQVEAILEATLAQAGYHRHKGGEWRKVGQAGRPPKQEVTMVEETEPAQSPAVNEGSGGHDTPAGNEAGGGHDTRAGNEAGGGQDTPAVNEMALNEAGVGDDTPGGNEVRLSKNPMLTWEEDQILARASQGDYRALPRTREILKRFGPRGMRPLPDLVRTDMLEDICDADLLMYEDLRSQMENLRRDLAGPDCSPLEQLLADRVTLCWLDVHYCELRWWHYGDDAPPKRSEYDLRGLESAHRRYLSAIRSLAQVRKMQLPSVQLNLANQQINLADRQVNLPPGDLED